MTDATHDNWADANQRYLMARLAIVRAALARHVARVSSARAVEQSQAATIEPNEATTNEQHQALTVAPADTETNVDKDEAAPVAEAESLEH
ncbi:MAG TPA: hypothetical protein VE821_04380, partial [Pyrinomonadaceae bacterium]|nr:hypothetical protein [Pyrinomonadaceae bacterium]